MVQACLLMLHLFTFYFVYLKVVVLLATEVSNSCLDGIAWILLPFLDQEKLVGGFNPSEKY